MSRAGFMGPAIRTDGEPRVTICPTPAADAGLGVPCPWRRSQFRHGLGQPRHHPGTLSYLEAGAVKVVPDGLIAPPEALRQEPLTDRVERQPVLRACKAMPLVRVEHIGDRKLFLVHR